MSTNPDSIRTERRVKLARIARRYGSRPGLLLATLIATLSLAVACGDNDDDTTPDSTPATVVDAAETPEQTPFPTPEIDGVTLTFREKGYSVEAPEGFLVEPNYVFNPTGARFPTDAFILPEAVDEIQPSITITCNSPREDETLDQYRERREDFASSFAAGDVESREMSVDGEDAYAVEYAQQLRARTGEDVTTHVDKTDVIFIANDCQWQLSLTAPEGSRDEYRPAFDYVLDTFTLLD